MNPDAMMRAQKRFYNRAVDEILEETTLCFKKKFAQHKMKAKEFKSLYLLDGTRVTSLLDIPQEAKVLICSDQNRYLGIEFEDVKLTQLNKQASLADLVAEKSNKFSNAFLKPSMASLPADNKRFFP